MKGAPPFKQIARGCSTLELLFLPSFFNMSVAFNSIEKLFRGLERAPLGFGKFEFRWHKLTAKCLGKSERTRTQVQISELRYGIVC